MPASENIPVIAQAYVSDRAKKTLDLVRLSPENTSMSINGI